MMDPTSVGRGRPLARRALLALTTALCAALTQSASAADYTPPKIYTTTPGGINLSDGSFMLSETDLSIGSLTLTRHSIGGLRDPNTTPFGPRMTHNFDIFLARNVRTVCTGTGPGTCTTYGKPVVHLGTSASGTFYEHNVTHNVMHNDQDSYSGELTYNSATTKYEYLDADGNLYIFDPATPVPGAANAARVTQITYADGNVRTFTYDGSNRLKLVQDARGYALVFDYNSYGFIASACGFNRASAYVTSATTCTAASLKAQYSYSAGSAHTLDSVVDAGGRQESYTFGTSSAFAWLSCVKPSGYSSCKVSNAGSWKTTSQTLADGAAWQFAYWGDPEKARDPDKYAETEPSFTMVVTDPNQKTSSYSFVQSSPWSFTDQLNRTTTYRYTGGTQFGGQDRSIEHGSMLVNVTYPAGNQWIAEYYAPRNAISKRTLKSASGTELTVNLGYVSSCDAPNNPTWCGKPIYVQDELGHQTDYAYTAFGSIASEMQPAPSTGAARPLKLYTYVQKYAYVKNASGTLVQASVPVWLPSTETLCQTAANSSTAVCDGSAPQVVTSYEYGANGTADTLLLRGKVVTAGGQSLRTCYRYDAQANKIAETSPRAGLTTCS